MLGLIAVMAFVVVAMGAFAIGSLLDERNARARLMRERLTSVQKAAERQPSEELALLRDEMLSEIPALDEFLRRSARVSQVQNVLLQADMKLRAGNFLALCLVCAIALGAFLLFWNRNANYAALLGWVGLILGFFIP